MKNTTLLVCLIAVSFCLGMGFKTIIDKQSDGKAEIKKATGIGGIFFKCKNPRATREWYRKHLGLNTNDYGAVFEWWQGADSTKKGFTQWSTFSEKTKYFEPSTRDFMINYRVENLVSLIDGLKKDSVTVVDTIQTVEYGKFVHILDGEGNKVELWEPNDVAYEKLGNQIGAKTTK